MRRSHRSRMRRCEARPLLLVALLLSLVPCWVAGQAGAAADAAAPAPQQEEPSSRNATALGALSRQQNITFCVADWEPISICKNATATAPGQCVATMGRQRRWAPRMHDGHMRSTCPLVPELQASPAASLLPPCSLLHGPRRGDDSLCSPHPGPAGGRQLPVPGTAIQALLPCWQGGGGAAGERLCSCTLQWPVASGHRAAACCLLLQCTAFGTLIADLQNSTGVCSASASGITITTEREQLGIKFTCES